MSDQSLQALTDFYKLLDVKKYEPQYGRKRSCWSKKFRRDLNRIIGSHDWICADKHRMEIIEEARRLRKYLRHRPPTIPIISGWYFFQRMREQSICRRIFKLQKLGKAS